MKNEEVETGVSCELIFLDFLVVGGVVVMELGVWWCGGYWFCASRFVHF